MDLFMNHDWVSPKFFQYTVFEGINKSMTSLAEQFEQRLSKINRAKVLFCFSDYSGEEKESNNSVYSFLIVDGDNLSEWDKKRLQIRSEILSDGRRISFKNYRDKLSERYIKRYLPIVDELPGYLITISVSKEIDSLFEIEAATKLFKQEFGDFPASTPDTIEKIFRVIHFLSFFIAGFSNANQDIIWITDNDKIAPNRNRLGLLTTLFGHVATMYLNHDLGHLRVGTTELDDGSKLVEDLCSITDLAAGSFSDQFKVTESKTREVLPNVFWIYSPDFRRKTKDLIWWLSTSQKNLCKLYFKINRGLEGKHVTSFYHFFNQG